MSTPPLFHRAHYNILSNQIRESLDKAIKFHDPGFDKFKTMDRSGKYYAIEAIVNLALSLAARFKKDNPNFDHLRWLNDCSPDANVYPLAELWEDE